MIRLIGLDQIDTVWPMVAAEMDRGCRKARSSMTAPEMYRACRMGGWYLALVTNGEGGILGAAVLDIREHPLGRTLHIMALCGRDLRTWLPMMMTQWPWLDDMAIDRVVAEGRPGFDRMMRQALPGVRQIRSVVEWDRRHAR